MALLKTDPSATLRDDKLCFAYQAFTNCALIMLGMKSIILLSSVPRCLCGEMPLFAGFTLADGGSSFCVGGAATLGFALVP
jgi:hypothetical protein